MAKKKKKIQYQMLAKDVEQLELSYFAAGDAKWHSHFRKSLAVLYEVKHITAIWPGNPTLRYLSKES